MAAVGRARLREFAEKEEEENNLEYLQTTGD